MSKIEGNYNNSYYNNTVQQQTVINDKNQKNENITSIDVSNSKISAENNVQQADEFLAQHDKLYAEQQAAVMKTITEGMAVAQEIARRMSSGAKVSQSDENNLMQYDMRMYMAAKNAQLMAERKKDMSDESLIDQFNERHANDRKDWTSEPDQHISVAGSAEAANTAAPQPTGNIDISI